MSMNVLILRSVNYCIDCDGITYPLHINGTPDMQKGVHYNDVGKEWLDKLSDDDAAELKDWLHNKNK